MASRAKKNATIEHKEPAPSAAGAGRMDSFFGGSDPNFGFGPAPALSMFLQRNPSLASLRAQQPTLPDEVITTEQALTDSHQRVYAIGGMLIDELCVRFDATMMTEETVRLFQRCVSSMMIEAVDNLEALAAACFVLSCQAFRDRHRATSDATVQLSMSGLSTSNIPQDPRLPMEATPSGLPTALHIPTPEEVCDPRNSETGQPRSFDSREVRRYMQMINHVIRAERPYVVEALMDSMYKFFGDLSLGKETQRLAAHMANDAVRLGLCARRNSPSLSAAAIYLACILQNIRITQSEFCRAISLTEVTLRKVYKELFPHWEKLIPAWYRPRQIPTEFQNSRKEARKRKAALDLSGILLSSGSTANILGDKRFPSKGGKFSEFSDVSSAVRPPPPHYSSASRSSDPMDHPAPVAPVAEEAGTNDVEAQWTQQEYVPGRSDAPTPPIDWDEPAVAEPVAMGDASLLLPPGGVPLQMGPAPFQFPLSQELSRMPSFPGVLTINDASLQRIPSGLWLNDNSAHTSEKLNQGATDFAGFSFLTMPQPSATNNLVKTESSAFVSNLLRVDSSSQLPPSQPSAPTDPPALDAPDADQNAPALSAEHGSEAQSAGADGPAQSSSSPQTASSTAPTSSSTAAAGQPTVSKTHSVLRRHVRTMLAGNPWFPPGYTQIPGGYLVPMQFNLIGQKIAFVQPPPVPASAPAAPAAAGASPGNGNGNGKAGLMSRADSFSRFPWYRSLANSLHPSIQTNVEVIRGEPAPQESALSSLAAAALSMSGSGPPIATLLKESKQSRRPVPIERGAMGVGAFIGYPMPKVVYGCMGNDPALLSFPMKAADLRAVALVPPYNPYGSAQDVLPPPPSSSN